MAYSDPAFSVEDPKDEGSITRCNFYHQLSRERPQPLQHSLLMHLYCPGIRNSAPLPLHCTALCNAALSVHSSLQRQLHTVALHSTPRSTLYNITQYNVLEALLLPPEESRREKGVLHRLRSP